MRRKLQMSESTERAAIAFEVSNFIALYWEDGEKNKAKGMADFISEDFVYDAKVLRLEGRKQVCDFTQKRSEAVRSVGGHRMSNLYFDFSGWAERQEVTMRGVMAWYGGVGKGVLPVSLP